MKINCDSNLNAVHKILIEITHNMFQNKVMHFTIRNNQNNFGNLDAWYN